MMSVEGIGLASVKREGWCQDLRTGVSWYPHTKDLQVYLDTLHWWERKAAVKAWHQALKVDAITRAQGRY